MTEGYQSSAFEDVPVSDSSRLLNQSQDHSSIIYQENDPVRHENVFAITEGSEYSLHRDEYIPTQTVSIKEALMPSFTHYIGIGLIKWTLWVAYALCILMLLG